MGGPGILVRSGMDFEQLGVDLFNVELDCELCGVKKCC